MMSLPTELPSLTCADYLCRLMQPIPATFHADLESNYTEPWIGQSAVPSTDVLIWTSNITYGIVLVHRNGTQNGLLWVSVHAELSVHQDFGEYITLCRCILVLCFFDSILSWTHQQQNSWWHFLHCCMFVHVVFASDIAL